MQRAGFTIASVLVVALLSVGGYYSIRALRDPALYIPKDTEKIGDIHPLTTEPDTGADTGTGSADTSAAPVSRASASAGDSSQGQASGATGSSATPSSGTRAGTPGVLKTSWGQAVPSDLEDRLTALMNAKTVLKAGSKGSDVDMVEQFMNLYFRKSSAIDSIFGKTLTANVTTFQKQNKLPQTGQVASQTVQKMIEWLHNNDS